MLFVGTGTNTGSKGIYSFQFDSSSGELKPLGLAAEAPSPSFLALSPDKQFLFAVNEIDTYQGEKTGAVSSYTLDKASGKLTLINTVASGGSGPCHVNTDQTGRVLLVANYSGGSAASFQIDWNGRLSKAVSEFHYESTGAGPGQDKDRQAASHAHHATTSPDNHYAYINDLGLDCIHIYKLDPAKAKLTPNNPAEWKAAPGSGPRVLRFHPNGQWAYCVNELASTIDLLNWHPQTGALTLVQKTELLPRDFHGISRAAEIIFDKQGKFAYAANRDNDFLVRVRTSISRTENSLSRAKPPAEARFPAISLSIPPRSGFWSPTRIPTSSRSSPRSEERPACKRQARRHPIQSPQCLLFV